MSDNTFPEEVLPPPAEKRARSKDESPMARAKTAATQLRKFDTTCVETRNFIAKLNGKLDKAAAERQAFVLTLDDSVIAILKAGGAL